MTKAAELAKMGEVLTNGQIGGRRNIIINGAMNVAQRSTSETGKGDANGFLLVIDGESMLVAQQQQEDLLCLKPQMCMMALLML